MATSYELVYLAEINIFGVDRIGDKISIRELRIAIAAGSRSGRQIENDSRHIQSMREVHMYMEKWMKLKKRIKCEILIFLSTPGEKNSVLGRRITPLCSGYEPIITY